MCGLAGLALGLFTEWSFFPFVDDQGQPQGPGFFLKNVTSLNGVTLLMIAAGAFFAYWMGKDSGFRMLPRRARSAAATERQQVPPPV